MADSTADTDASDEPPAQTRPAPAPELSAADGPWHHVAAPVDLADLTGRLVLLYFFAYTSEPCAALAAELEDVAARFEREVQVIGVHVPRYPDETALAEALQRLDITQPVVADARFALARAYGVRGWPSLVVISPDGYILAHMSGLPAEPLEATVGGVLEGLRGRGELAPKPLAATEPRESDAPLRFPQGLCRLPEGAAWAWAIADTGHHRVIGMAADGAPLKQVGSGSPGFADGPAETARFDTPTALAAAPHGDAVVVADTGNHALRLVTVSTGHVTTLAGTGWRGRPLYQPSRARQTRLAAPTGVAVFHGRVLFANAGTHQLGTLDLKRREVARLAGTGQEGLADGPAGRCQFAQPAALGLTQSTPGLYVLDSASSALRWLDLSGGHSVTTLAGQGVYEHGFADGDRDTALLQHPEALAVDPDDDACLIADTLNAALRRYSPETGRLATLHSPPTGLLASGERLDEPRALALGDGELVVADTNGHRLRRFGYR